MKRLLIGWIMVGAIFVSSVPWELVDSPPFEDAGISIAVEVSDGSDCPEDDAPCEPCGGCLCPGCPALVVCPDVPATPVLSLPEAREASRPPYEQRPGPRGVHSRVFHPPRLV